jgi:anti-sigma-K factor RskA
MIQARVSGIAGKAQLRVADEHGELIVRHLSPPPAGHVYEVWLKPGRGAPEPAGVLFNVTSVGSAELKLPVSLRRIGQVMVSPEPTGGSPAPTHTPVIVARIS